LPGVDALFTLVRRLASRQPVIEVAAPKWLVRRHGLAAMAARAGAGTYRDELARATIEWSRIDVELAPVVTAFVAAGIRVAAIKGVAYAKSLYDSPAERPMGDVDLLVQPADYSRAAAVLTSAGFVAGVSPVLHHAHAWVRETFVIDLHRSIIAPGRSRIDLAAVWARMQPGWPDCAERLEPTDALVFHLVNLARNRLRVPLIHVIDTERLCQQGDATTAIERARSWGLGRGAELALRFCTSILEERAGRPAGWLGPSVHDAVELHEPSVVHKVLFDVATAGSAPQLASRVVHFAANRLRRLSSR